MTTVGDILTFMETLAPAYMKMEWDNVGLLCGSAHAPVKKILVALDPFVSVCQEAEQIGADLLITHHPLIFQPLSSVTDDTSTGKAVAALLRADISAINAHTNLDCAPDGVNDTLAALLGLQDVQVLNPAGKDEGGRPYGLLRAGTVAQQPVQQFLQQIEAALGCETLRYVSSGRPVHRVAVGGGACGGAVAEAAAAGCDTLVTADVKYNQFFDARDLGITLIDAGHFHTENPICAVIAKKISAAFDQVEVVVSQTHRDCVKFY